VHCKRSVEAAYHDQAGWTRRAILNVANMGVFSSDRTILSYARDIWGVYLPPAGAPRSQVPPLRESIPLSSHAPQLPTVPSLK
jgi:hypothetical protein